MHRNSVKICWNDSQLVLPKNFSSVAVAMYLPPIRLRRQNFSQKSKDSPASAMEGQKSEKRNKKRKAAKENEFTSSKTAVEETPSFASFRLDPRLLKAVTNQFEKPTLVQAAAIPLALAGKDIVARAMTGSGKTAAYVIPVINQILTKSVCPWVLELTCRTKQTNGRLRSCSFRLRNWRNKLLKSSFK